MFGNVMCGLHLQPVKLEDIKDDVLSATKKIRFFVGEDTAQKQKVYASLKAEYVSLLEKEKKYLADVKSKLEALKKEIERVKEQIVNKSNVDFYTKELGWLNKQHQIILDIRDTKQQILETLKQHIDYLKKFFESGIDAEEKVIQKSMYSFAELQNLTHKIMTEQEHLARLEKKKDRAESDMTSSEEAVAVREKNIKKLSLDIENLKKDASRSIKDQLTLLDLEQQTVHKERDLSLMRVEEQARQIEFIDSQMFVANKKIERFNTDLMTVRNKVRVDKTDVQHYQHLSDKVKKEVQAQKSDLIKKQTEYSAQKSHVQRELEKLSKRYKISLSNIRAVEEWESSPETINEAFASYSVSFAETRVVALDRKIELVRVGLLLEDAKAAQAQVLVDTVKSLYGITQAQFRDNEQLDEERAHYKDLRSSINSMIKSYQEKVTAAHNFIKIQHKALTNLKKHQDGMKNYSKKQITVNQRKYNEVVAMLGKAIKKVEEQNEISLQLSEKYTALADLKEETLVSVSFMLHELDLIGVWHRSTRAVTWEGVKQIIPNLIVFTQNLRSVIGDYLFQFSLKNSLYEVLHSSASSVFTFIMLLLLLLMLYFVLQATLPGVQGLCNLVKSDKQVLFAFSKFLFVFIDFVLVHLKAIFLWGSAFLLLNWYDAPIALTLMFYAYSIAFLIVISRNFLQYLLRYNSDEHYILLGKNFQDRFKWVFSFFSVSTIVILFFRKMFMLVMIYQQSEFPTILLRLYHVVIFVSIVFSIEKEELLNLMPRHYGLTEKISEFINNYYYLISVCLIGLLIMSDPYLGGYGSLVWYILWNGLVTSLIVMAMYVSHNFIKRYSSILFFIEDSELGNTKERFDHAKTWYAVFVVSLFLMFVGGTGLICAYVWGYKIAGDQFIAFLNYPVFGIEQANGKNKYLLVKGLLRLIFSGVMGIVFAYLFRKYVLQKIFDIQYVDPGVQDTVVTISRYLIIISMILVGFAREGLGFVVMYIIGIGLLTFGWSFKDLFTDVVAYFFILVQRPIKLGDYIKIDSNTMGIVRKIGPRAVVLRRKNSVTIVVPNSIVLKNALYNWNYTRSYLAFDDIVFTVPFGTDIHKVRTLLLQVIEEDPDTLRVPEPVIRVDDFNDKGYEFMVRAFLSAGNTLKQWKIASNVRFAIVKRLSENGIEIAEPIMRVNMKKNRQILEDHE